MLDLGWSELLVVGAVAVVVVGPKEMPKVVRTVSNMFAKIRGMTGEFQQSMNEMADSEDLLKIRKELEQHNDMFQSNLSNANEIISDSGESIKSKTKSKTKPKPKSKATVKKATKSKATVKKTVKPKSKKLSKQKV